MDGAKIRANFIIELLGKPAEHLTEAIRTHVTKMGSEKEIEIIKKEYHEPVLAEDSKEVFTTFAEIEAEFKSIEGYLGIVFAYLPSHIEIIKPEKITITNSDLGDIGTKILQRIHSYDAVVKNVLQERENLVKIIQEEAPNLFKKLTTPKDKKNENNKEQTNKKQPTKKKNSKKSVKKGKTKKK